MASPEKTEVKDEVAMADADAALQFLKQDHAEGTFTEINERSLVRKIDRRIIPLMWGAYFLQYLDKTLINYAAVMGLQEDTNTSTDQFAWLATIFYISYCIMEPPSGYLMQRLPTAKFLGAMVALWGVMVACTAACNNYPALMVLRFLLGCFESAVAPALILITTMWYKKHEQPPRLGIWYLGTGTAQIVGGLLSFAFQHVHSPRFHSWQILFLCCGLLTICMGITIIIFLPDNPMSAKFLTDHEKVIAIERLRENQTGIENKQFKPQQLKECLLDVQTWLIFIITAAANVSNGATSTYSSTIIKSFGFSSEETTLINIPGGVIAILTILFTTYIAGRTSYRGYPLIGVLSSGLLGSALLAWAPTHAGQLAGNYILNMIGTCLPLLYSWAAANYAGHTKKVTINAILLMAFCIGNIIGPLTFRGADAPGFLPAKVAVVITICVSIAGTVMLIPYYAKENRRRDRVMAGKEHVRDVEFLDLTDRENGEFRYRL